MVSSSHEVMHRIFQEDPGLFSRAFEELLGISLPEPEAISILTPDLTEIRPLERRVDTLLRVDIPDGKGYLVAIEAQGRKDPDKPGSWAYYLAHLYAKYRCPPLLLVVCQDKATATWAAEPIEIGFPGQRPTLIVNPLVLGPDNVPVIREMEEAVRDIPLAVFSAITHGKDPDAAAILKTLAEALQDTDADTAGTFAELTGLGLGDTPAGHIWRDLMSAHTTGWRSPWVEAAHEEGLRQGREIGRAHV